MRARILPILWLAVLGVPGSAGSLAPAHQQSLGVILDAKTGRILGAVRFNKPVRAALGDGHGGWFVGGSFIRVDGVLRKRLAHIDANGRLDPRWKPEANGNGVSVTSLARAGSRLYVGGDFARLDGQPRLWVGAVSSRTGRLLQWQPRRGAVNYPVLLAAHGDVYLGGYAVESGSGLIALSPRDAGPVATWHGNVDTSNIEGGSVRMLAIRGRRLYVAGFFEKVDGARASGIAAVDAESGRLLQRWRPPLRSRLCSACTQVGALAAARERIYAGLPSGLVALDPVTGAIERNWRVRLGGNSAGAEVNALARAGRRLYVTGSFVSIGGHPRVSFGAVNVETGRVERTWTPRGTAAYGNVLAVSGSRILLGIEVTA